MLRLAGEAEAGFWGLYRAAQRAGGHLARLADAIYDHVRPAPPPPEAPPPQLELWVIDAEGLPPRPWRIYRDSIVVCQTLRCPVPAHICVSRQQASELQRTQDTWRGVAPEHPSCVTEKCAQGRGVRMALDPNAGVAWRGTGPRGRMAGRGRRADRPAQDAARQKLERAGLLGEVRTLDIDPDPVVEDE